MELELPLYSNGKYEYRIISEREPCSNDCLIIHREILAFYSPGLRGNVNHLNYSLLTKNKTLIKKKNDENIRWNNLSYNYSIDSSIQDNIYKQLIKHPIEGLNRIVHQCSCSYELEFLSGGILAYSNSLPISRHYKNFFSTVEKWDHVRFKKFLYSSSSIICNLHARQLIHGDLTAHNFIITDSDEVVLIDLDTLIEGTDVLYKQDIMSYVIYTLTPILKSFESVDNVEKFVGLFVYHFERCERVSDWRQLLIKCYETFKGTSTPQNPLIHAYFYNLKLLEQFAGDNHEVTKKIQLLQLEILESNRTKEIHAKKQQEYFSKQLKEAAEYAKSLEIKSEDTTRYAISLELKIKENEEYAISLKDSLTTLETKYAELEKYTQSLELVREELDKKIEELETDFQQLESQLNSEKKEKISLEDNLRKSNQQLLKEKNKTLIEKIFKK
jgi:serine/threonine protein kinase